MPTSPLTQKPLKDPFWAEACSSLWLRIAKKPFVAVFFKVLFCFALLCFVFARTLGRLWVTLSHSASSTPVRVAVVTMKVAVAVARALSLAGLVPLGAARHCGDSFGMFSLHGHLLYVQKAKQHLVSKGPHGLWRLIRRTCQVHSAWSSFSTMRPSFKGPTGEEHSTILTVAQLCFITVPDPNHPCRCEPSTHAPFLPKVTCSFLCHDPAWAAGR